MTIILLIFILALGIGYLSTWGAAQFKLPHSVFLVVLGLAFGAYLRHPLGNADLVSQFAKIYPDLIFYILLPPLVFESAYHLDWNHFKKDAVPLFVLSAIALIVSALFVGYSLHWLTLIPILPCLVFGSLISATDPVAVVSLFKELKISKRLTTLIEGESLLNDGTAIVLFRIFLGLSLASGRETSTFLGILQFFGVTAGGALLGLAVGFCTRCLIRLVPSVPSQLGLMVVAAYFSFLMADHFLGVSGVIATLATGLFLKNYAEKDLGYHAWMSTQEFWEFFALSANTLVFLFLGVMVDGALLFTYLNWLPVACGVVYLARAFSIFLTVPILNSLRLARQISGGDQFLLFWGGLRGGLALALVLALPPEFPERQFFLSLTTSVVLATILLNALSIRPILKALKYS